MIAAVMQTGHITISDLILSAAIAGAGLAAWRSKRGDFYKSAVEEKSAEVEKLRGETENLRNETEKLRNATDIRPILKSLETVAAAVERSNETSDAVLSKVAEMNGSLRAHATAMEALADRIVLDEAAKGLLAAAAEDKPRAAPAPRRRRTS